MRVENFIKTQESLKLLQTFEKTVFSMKTRPYLVNVKLGGFNKINHESFTEIRERSIAYPTSDYKVGSLHNAHVSVPH